MKPFERSRTSFFSSATVRRSTGTCEDVWTNQGNVCAIQASTNLEGIPSTSVGAEVMLLLRLHLRVVPDLKLTLALVTTHDRHLRDGTFVVRTQTTRSNDVVLERLSLPGSRLKAQEHRAILWHQGVM